MPLAFVTMARSDGGATREGDVGLAGAGGGGVELADGFLWQPAIKTVATIIPMRIAFFMEGNVT